MTEGHMSDAITREKNGDVRVIDEHRGRASAVSASTIRYPQIGFDAEAIAFARHTGVVFPPCRRD